MEIDSECESDVSSISQNPTDLNCEDLIKRVDSLTQENRVLQIELQTYKLRLKALEQEIKLLKNESINLHVKTEEEEEFISNKLLKKIKQLKQEKQCLANNYEREEEFLTNDLTRKLQRIREEKESLEQSLAKEQSLQIDQLMKRIHRLESEIVNKQNTLEQLKHEKVDLENTLEKQQESLVNRLWKRMETLESDKKSLQLKLQQSHLYNTNSEPSSSNDLTNDEKVNTRSYSLSNMICVEQLKQEIERLRQDLTLEKEINEKKFEQLKLDEEKARNENLRLQRKLQVEIDRREQLCKQLSESESSLEMNEERVLIQNIQFHSKYSQNQEKSTTNSFPSSLSRSRTASSPAFIINKNL